MQSNNNTATIITALYYSKVSGEFIEHEYKVEKIFRGGVAHYRQRDTFCMEESDLCQIGGNNDFVEIYYLPCQKEVARKLFFNTLSDYVNAQEAKLSKLKELITKNLQ